MFATLQSKNLAQNQNKNFEEVGSKTVTAKFQYAKLTPKISYVSKSGRFSRFEDNTLIIGDGESVDLKFEVAESKADGFIKSVEYRQSDNSVGISKTSTAATDSYKIFGFKDLNGDKTTQQYLIHEAYVPVYNGAILTEYQMKQMYFSAYHEDRGSDCLNQWRLCYNGTVFETWTCGAYGGGNSDNIAIRKDETYTGKRYNISDFESNPWFVTRNLGDSAPTCGGWWGCHVSLSKYVQSRHVSAELVASNDASVVQYKQIGYLEIIFTHRGRDESSNIRVPVYYEMRYCDYKGTGVN